jgi:hypothetical protein
MTAMSRGGPTFLFAVALGCAPPTEPAPGISRSPLVTGLQIRSGSYAGSGVARSITGVGFQADLLIIKVDSTLQDAQLRTSTMPTDSSKVAVFTSTIATGRITSLDVDGFSVGNHPYVNASGLNYYWTAVQAGSTAMKVGSYAGDGTDNRAISGVGFAPELVIVLPSGLAAVVQRFAAMAGDASLQIGNTALETNLIQALLADGFQVGSDSRVNDATQTYHYVAFRSVAGVSKVGSLTGDGLDNRDIAGLGFAPELVYLRANGAGGVHRSTAISASTDLTIPLDSLALSANGIQSLGADGFQLGSAATVNPSGMQVWFGAFRSSANARLAFTTPARTFSAGVCGGQANRIQVQLQDGAGVPLAAPTGGQALRATSSAGATATWYLDTACSSVAANGDFIIQAGQTSVDLIYADTQAGSPSVALTNPSGLDDPAAQLESVVTATLDAGAPDGGRSAGDAGTDGGTAIGDGGPDAGPAAEGGDGGRDAGDGGRVATADGGGGGPGGRYSAGGCGCDGSGESTLALDLAALAVLMMTVRRRPP